MNAVREIPPNTVSSRDVVRSVADTLMLNGGTESDAATLHSGQGQSPLRLAPARSKKVDRANGQLTCRRVAQPASSASLTPDPGKGAGCRPIGASPTTSLRASSAESSLERARDG